MAREGNWENFDWQNFQREQREFRKKYEEKFDEVLTDDQKKKYSAYKRNKRRYPDVYKALGDLDITDGEIASAILDVLMEVAKAKRDLERQEERNRRSARSLLRDKDKTDEEHQASLDELRGKRREASAALREAQKSLREIVSYRQELVLLRHGFLK